MPEPSRLILFEQLHTAQQGTKVRFLAWYISTFPLSSISRSQRLTHLSVDSYDPKTAKLILQDRYASSTTPAVQSATVNVDNILENISRELLEVGAWINVVGTMREAVAIDRVPSKSGRNRSSKSRKAASPVVDATMIWSAGAIKLEEYRAAVEAYSSALPFE